MYSVISRNAVLTCLFLATFVAGDMAAGPSSFATGSGFVLGTASEFESGGATRLEVAYLDTNKFVVCYADGVAGQCRAATVSGTTITWGTEVEFDADIVTPQSLLGVCRLDTNKFAVAYGDSSAGDSGYTRAASVSGTTISFGTAVQFDAGDAESIGCTGVSTGKYLVVYNDETNSDTGTGVACTIDAATPPAVTCGAENDYAATDYQSRYNRAAKIDTDKFVAVFRGADASDGFAVAGTTQQADPNHRVITWGTVATITTNNVSNTFPCAPQDANRFVVVYNNETGTAGEAVAGTVAAGAGTDITLGTAVDFNPPTQDIGVPACEFISATRFLVSYADTGGASAYGVVKTCDVDWTTRAIQCSGQKTYAALDTFEAILTDGQILVLLDGYGTTDAKFAVGYFDDTDNSADAIIGDVVPRRMIRWE
jgi:hypothetical protein